MSCAQDTITTNDVKVIKARSEITIERYFNNLLNSISYTGAESTDIKGLITQSVEDSDKRIFLNGQIAVAGAPGRNHIAVGVKRITGRGGAVGVMTSGRQL